MPFSAQILAHAAAETLKISVPAVLRSRRGPLSREYCDEKLRRWAQSLLAEAHVNVQVRGLEHLEKVPGPFLVVSNHQSLYDIPLLIASLPLSLRMAAKKELFKTPIWGPAMKAAGFVLIDRKNRERAYEALMEAGAALRKDGVSLHIAPEGTRSKDGSLGPFKRGAFELAKVTGLPLLPVTISGALEVHRAGETVVHRGKQVTITVHSPLVASEDKSSETLRDECRTLILAGLSQA